MCIPLELVPLNSDLTEFRHMWITTCQLNLVRQRWTHGVKLTSVELG